MIALRHADQSALPPDTRVEFYEKCAMRASSWPIPNLLKSSNAQHTHTHPNIPSNIFIKEFGIRVIEKPTHISRGESMPRAESSRIKKSNTRDEIGEIHDLGS